MIYGNKMQMCSGAQCAPYDKLLNLKNINKLGNPQKKGSKKLWERL